MSTEEITSGRSSLWRRISERLSRFNISRLARALTCGNQKPEVKERYMSNHELDHQLCKLDFRFYIQTLRLNESSNIDRRMLKMAKASKARDEQFERLGEMVDAIQENRKFGSDERSIESK